MASSADETKKMRDAALEARENFQAISDILSKNLATTKASAAIMDQVNKNLKGQLSLEDQIQTLENEKQAYLEEQLRTGKIINEDLTKRLDMSLDLLKKEKQRKDNLQEMQDLQEEFNGTLKSALGLSDEYVKAFKVGGVAALGWMAATKAVEKLGEMWDNTVGLAADFYKNMGASVAESAAVAGQVAKASFSIEGMIYGQEAMAESAKSIAEYYGSTAAISSEMLKATTKLTAMGADNAAQMAGIFESAGGDAGVLTDEIKDIAHGVGVDASGVIADMSKHQNLMVGKSKEEIKILARKTAELKKQGMSLELMDSVSSNMLDVESSLRAEMKARMLLGKDINVQKVREAAATYQMTGDATDLGNALKEQLGTAEEFGKLGPMQQKAYADAFGMTTDQVTEMLTKQEQVAKYGEKGSEYIDMMTGGLAMAGNGAAAFAKQLAGAVIQAGILNKMSGKGFGLSNLNPMGGKGKAPAIPSTSGGGGGGGPIDSITGSMGKMDMGKVLKGAAALVLVAAAVFVFGKAVQEFMKVSWEAVGMAVVSMLALVGALALVGTIMMSGVGAVAILAGAAAMLVIAAAMFVLGKAIQEIATGFGMMGQLTEQLTGLVMIAPGLIALAGIFTMLGLSMIPLAIGLALITPFLGTLIVLGMMLPLIASAFGLGGDSESSSSSSGGSDSDPLLEEIKGLRSDIQNQPVQIVINDKVVTEISKKANRMQGYRNQMK